MSEKHLIVNANIHRKAKMQALMRDMTIKEYIEFLLDADKQVMNEKLKG